MTLGTTKNPSSASGALARINGSISPSVTTSSRIGSFIGMTEVIGSTPETSTALKLLDEGEDGVDLALQMRNLRVGHGDAREMRDAADGGLIDGHDNSLTLAPFGKRAL